DGVDDKIGDDEGTGNQNKQDKADEQAAAPVAAGRPAGVFFFHVRLLRVSDERRQVDDSAEAVQARLASCAANAIPSPPTERGKAVSPSLPAGKGMGDGVSALETRPNTG